MKTLESKAQLKMNNPGFQEDRQDFFTAQCKGYAARTNFPTVQRKSGKRDLPSGLKAGIENLSGLAMDDVTVHYNSSKPSGIQALAYTQGSDIHLGPGQERHLAHEAWHVVQQRQGRVKPTMHLEGKAINDDQRLEKEADQRGKQAAGFKSRDLQEPVQKVSNEKEIKNGAKGSSPVQRVDEHKDTGLKKNAAVGRFAGKVKARTTGAANPLGGTKKWATLSNQQRADKMVKYANAELDTAHVPKLTGANLNPAAAQPSFRHDTWDMELVGDLSRTDDAYIEWMVDATYHESRHAEQWFRMARLRAGQDKTATEIATELGIPNNIAAAAVKRPLKALTATSKAFHSKKYAERHDTKMQEADDWYQSVYGTGSAHRTGVLTADPVDNAQYLALPEEVDAYIVGPKAKDKFKKLMGR